MIRAEISAASGDAFGLKTDCFIGSPRPDVFREDAKPYSIGIGFTENDLYEIGQKSCAVAAPGLTYGYSLDVGYAFGRSPIAYDGEPDRFGIEAGDEVSMSSVRKRLVMLGLGPTTDQLLVLRKPLGRHDKGDIVGCTPREQQGIRRKGARIVLPPRGFASSRLYGSTSLKYGSTLPESLMVSGLP